MTYENRRRKLKLSTLAYRRKRWDMIEAFKLTSGLYDAALPSLLEIQKNTRTRGHSKKLYQHRSNKDIRKNFFTNRIINSWKRHKCQRYENLRTQARQLLEGSGFAMQLRIQPHNRRRN